MVISISPEARAALIRMSSEAGILLPIFTVAYAKMVGTNEVRFGVGIYCKDESWEQERVLSIDGIEFYVDPSIEQQLPGKMLHFQNGKFSLAEKEE
jgi:hypothetical protein